MTTIENIGIGIARYIDGELASKTDGLKKWGLSLASVLIVAKITEMTTRYSDVLKSAGYMNENGMVDDVKLLSDLKSVAHEKGAVIQSLPYIGSFTFDESDIEMLGRYING